MTPSRQGPVSGIPEVRFVARRPGLVQRRLEPADPELDSAVARLTLDPVAGNEGREICSDPAAIRRSPRRT
jgi:hypothetical protein